MYSINSAADCVTERLTHAHYYTLPLGHCNWPFAPNSGPRGQWMTTASAWVYMYIVCIFIYIYTLCRYLYNIIHILCTILYWNFPSFINPRLIFHYSTAVPVVKCKYYYLLYYIMLYTQHHKIQFWTCTIIWRRTFYRSRLIQNLIFF